MQYPKLTAISVILTLILGYGATTEERASKIGYEAPVYVIEYANRGIQRLSWEYIERKAADGDACAIFLTGLNRLNVDRHGITPSFKRPAKWYTGVNPDPEEARKLIIDAANKGCDEAQLATWNYRLLEQGDPFRFLAYQGGLDWEKIRAYAETGDPDALYHVARTMKSHETLAVRRGIEFDPDKGWALLKALSDSGHFQASMEFWRDKPGLSPELERSYQIFLEGAHSARDGYLIHERYMGYAVRQCDLDAYGRAFAVYERIRHRAEHKRHEVLSRMNLFALTCMDLRPAKPKVAT